MINGFRVRCPTIRRSGNICLLMPNHLRLELDDRAMWTPILLDIRIYSHRKRLGLGKMGFLWYNGLVADSTKVLLLTF